MELAFLSAEAEDDEIEIRTNLTLQLCDFSDKINADYSTSKDLTETDFHIWSMLSSKHVYPNSFRNREYVKFIIHGSFGNSFFKGDVPDYYVKHFGCFISVIDNAGNKRFTRSFCGRRSREEGNEFYVAEDKYISRQTLLNDPTELLPNDILTIDVDIFLFFGCVEKRVENNFFLTIESDTYEDSFKLNTRSPDDTFQLITNSVVAKTLCEVSTFFRDMFAYTAEDNSELLEFSVNECECFYIICDIVKGQKYKVDGIGGIFNLLKISDKYDILNMPEVCRQIIKQFLCSIERLRPPMRYNRIFHEMLIQNAKDCRDTTVSELVEAFVTGVDPSLVKEEDNWDQEEENIFSGSKLTYEQSLGFKFTWLLDDPIKTYDNSFCK